MIEMIKFDENTWVPRECCTMTNPLTSGGESVPDDVHMPCENSDGCTGECSECVIQKIMNEYADLTGQQDRTGWRQQIADTIDRVVDKMLKETHTQNEAELIKCETMREAIKGVFLTQERTKAEIEFLVQNIDRYERIFELCMNGDDAQFRAGIRELQKAQNEYMLLRERRDNGNR